MNERENWKFTFTAKEVFHAIEQKLKYHQGRIGFWSGRQVEVMQKLKEAGVKVTESLVAQYSSNNFSNAGRGISVNLDQDLENQLSECLKKVAEHEKAKQVFERWSNYADHWPEGRQLELSFDDYAFFFSM